MVSPGLTEEVVRASRDHLVPILPGIARVAKSCAGLSLGLDIFKFFPAETSGGAPAIKVLGGPFPQVNSAHRRRLAQESGKYLSLPKWSAPAAPGWCRPTLALKAPPRSMPVSREASPD